MPCDEKEVDMNAPEAVPPCTPPKPTGNGGAGRVDLDGQMNSDSEDSDELQSAMSKRKWNGRESCTMIKCWMTGEQAEMDQDHTHRDLFELARDWMEDIGSVEAEEVSRPCRKGNRCCSVQAVS